MFNEQESGGYYYRWQRYNNLQSGTAWVTTGINFGQDARSPADPLSSLTYWPHGLFLSSPSMPHRKCHLLQTESVLRLPLAELVLLHLLHFITTFQLMYFSYFTLLQLSNQCTSPTSLHYNFPTNVLHLLHFITTFQPMYFTYFTSLQLSNQCTSPTSLHYNFPTNES